METKDQDRALLEVMISDSIKIGRPIEAVKALFKGGYGDLEQNEVQDIITQIYEGTELPVADDIVSSPPIMDELRDWVRDNKGIFTTAQLDREFGFTTRDARKQRSKYLKRITEEGLIAAVPQKVGTFYSLDTPLERVKYSKPSEGESVNLPMGLRTLVKLYAGNVIVIAGNPNSGKTAFLFNVMVDNMDKYEVHYFSSEMGVEELSLRLDGFNYVDPEKIFEQAYIYEGVPPLDDIKPSGNGKIIIIDYLEVSENFWEISGMIRDIWDRLDGGLAFVAIQKSFGQLLGRGGVFGLEKPRLYLSMDNNTMKIVKAKTWRVPTKNPNGMQTTFSLVNGCEFIQGSLGWHYPGGGG